MDPGKEGKSCGDLAGDDIQKGEESYGETGMEETAP